MAAIGDNQVRMANLCLIACFSVNGVSKLHSDILKYDVFKDYNDIYPGKLTNVTNGITARRWLNQGNPLLADMITGLIGDGYVHDLSKLSELKKFMEDDAVLSRLGEIKRQNKERLGRYIAEHNGLRVDPNSIFDVQVKRLHEYKRQLLNALEILHLYLAIKNGATIQPRTFIFGAKASAGYYMAKEIIRFICAIGDVVNRDASLNGQLKVVFLENYRVSLAETIYPAAEISEQISQAGKEASGTGNMKMMLNGAVTLGTMDGANVEIHDVVGPENIIIFGMNAAEVNELGRNGYNPWNVYNSNGYIKEIIEFVRRGGLDGKNFDTIINYLLQNDQYMTLADFESYRQAQERVAALYQDKRRWNQMSLRNIAESGIFSADRSVQEYIDNIWYKNC